MEISRTVKAIIDFLVDERWGGMEYVAFPTFKSVDKNELYTFVNSDEAADFCEGMSFDDDQYTYLATRSVYRALESAADEGTLQANSYGIRNIAQAVERYYQKLDEQNLETTDKKEIIMNEKNLEYLENQLKFAGFGEDLSGQLRENIASNKEEFQLNFKADYGKDTVLAKLNFKRSEQNIDMYFFNSYDLLLKKDGRDETLQQNFKVAFGNTFSVKEAYNMLDGRSVFKKHFKKDPDDDKKLQEYTAWSYLDFKNTDERGNFLMDKNFNYDLKKKLEEYPIKNFEYLNTQTRVVDMISKGNKASVMLKTSEGEKKVFVTAAPKFNSLNFYDENHQQIRMTPKKKEETPSVEQSQGESQGKKAGEAPAKDKKNSLKADGKDEPPKAKQTRGRKVG